MEGEKKGWTSFCSIVAMDFDCFCYRVCSICERMVSENNDSHCYYCNFNSFNVASSPSKRLYRLLLSVASDLNVVVVVCFDRAARVLLGCSADELFDFAKINPSAVVTAGKILEGEMFEMTLRKPTNGSAEHLRVVSVVPVRSGFRPVIETLRKLYGLRSSS